MLNRIFGIENKRRDPLHVIRDLYDSQRETMFTLHCDWYQKNLFREGFQDIDINMMSGTPMYHEGTEGGLTYNVVDGVMESLENILLAVNPRRKARAVRQDTIDQTETENANAILSWAAVHHGIDVLNEELANAKCTYGCAVIYVAWDDEAGPPVMTADGSVAPAGEPLLIIDAPFRWIWDNRVTNYKDARWAIRRTIQSEEYMRSMYPDVADKMSFGAYLSGRYDWMEQSLMDMNRLRSGGQINRRMPEGKGQCILYEAFIRPTEDDPQGLIIVAAGDHDGPAHLCDITENHYGNRIPAVLANLKRVSGRLHGKTPMERMMDPQIAFNKRNRQIDNACDLVGNPKILKQEGSCDDSELTNSIDIVEYAPTTQPPAYMTPPPLPPQIFEQKNSSLQTIMQMGQPYADSMERASDANSAIQLKMLAEREMQMTSGIIRKHANDWTDAWEIYVDLFRKKANYPREIGWMDADYEHHTRVISKEMLPAQLTLELVEKPELTYSRAAAYAEVVELGSQGFVDLANPFERQRALKEIGRGNLSSEYRDQTLDLDKARDNLIEIKYAGKIAIPDPNDDVDTHLAVYTSHKKTNEYKTWAMRDPQGAARLDQTILWFEQMKAAKMAQMQFAMEQMAQAQAMGKMGMNGGDRQAQIQAGKQARQPRRDSQGAASSNRPESTTGGR